ncbi:threonylcarbamoyladenosine tRNA methylthiotransferase-like [Portunus trituberculatus]|uniref:tRNA-t(6)A37 methylthiotransferase n=1 Tax=Portunus trituberculatus TaxID=210409 RepID=A0A5B7D1I8_PORTR|nr:threonylcarbamoyladenosine tRNA methylthiotransferase-like [Portunus trituberculatus]MPC15348.1 Threonylcarbamoyladenosine tRNA methylthiotransferase [Portunus trituberculatus]
MEDIEDLAGLGVDVAVPRHRNSVMPRVRRRKKAPVAKEGEEEVRCQDTCDSIVPGTQSVFVKTWGCAHNSSDGEYMAGQLAAYGYQIVEDKHLADVWLLNSCTVKNPAEDHFRNEIKAGREAGKKVVVAGCVPQGAPRSEFLEGLSVIGVQQIDRVVEVVEETLKGNSVRLLGQKKEAGKKTGGASLLLPKVRRNPLIEIISINTGCLNQCSYCKTKHARGELGSYPIEEVVERARQSFTEGVCEVWLTSEDTGAYGRDIGVTLPQLLWQLVEVIPEGCRLRLGMTNPPYILDHLKDIAEIMKHPRVYAFLHVPVQSGSDGVLGEMRREYTVKDFSTVVDFLKERVPGITIATDIICGFPTETEEDFEETLQLCSKYKFPSLFINQFYPRPGTPAARMKRIPTKEVKNRTRRLTELFQSYRPYDHKLGERQTVLVTEESHDKQHWVGHNKFYEQVLVPKKDDFLGKLVEVEIMETGKHYMRGRPIHTSRPKPPSSAEPLARGVVSGLSGVGDVHHTKQDLLKQERYIILSFILLISALLVKLAWVCFKMLKDF